MKKMLFLAYIFQNRKKSFFLQLLSFCSDIEFSRHLETTALCAC